MVVGGSGGKISTFGGMVKLKILTNNKLIDTTRDDDIEKENKNVRYMV